MNEQRLQAYYQLIQELLICADEAEVNRVLEANAELLDAEFLQVVVAVAEQFAEEERENIANWLMGLASRLSEELNLPLEVDTQEEATPSSEEDIDIYGQFLQEVLQATAESGGDAQVVYPLLAANTDKLNDTFTRILQVWATTTLAQAEADTAKSIVAVILTFSNLIQEFPLGNKASNMELAITGYEIALTVFTRTAFPQEWAGTQNNLGATYSDRIRGDKADNLEMAIAAYTASLEVYTRTAFPQQWAMTQNNLGIAYRNRIRGDKAENLEMAIAAHEASLEVFTRTDSPQDWARRKSNLGNAYRERIRGDKADNLEKAIAAFTASLEVLTRKDFPQDWAGTQNNLGIAYFERIRGDKADNLEKAIAAYTASLEVRTRTAFPQDWAGTQNNLGNAYRNRIRGDKADNLENAIAAYTDALKVYTRTAFAQDWAGTQNNLGNAYSDRIRGDKADNLEMAIAAYTASLEVRTRTAFPQDWAGTQNNLGNAYLNRIRGDKADNLELAINAFTASLEVYTLRTFPQDYVKTAYLISLAYRKAGRLISAYLFLETVINNWGLISYSDQLYLIYASIIEICLELNEHKLAIEYIEFSKNRNLLENIRQKVESDIEKEKSELIKKDGCVEKKDTSLTNLKTLRKQQEQLIKTSIGLIPMSFREIQNLISDEVVIIQWYIFSDCFRAFIITCTNDKPEIWTSTPEDLNNLKDFIFDEYLRSYYKDKSKWRNQLNSQLTKLSEVIHLQEIIDKVPPHCQKIILIPHLYLHLLPLHAVPLSPTSPEYLIDRFPGGVSYAPSCQLLRYAQNQAQRLTSLPQTTLSNLFAIQNPTNDLAFTNIEVETIATKFNPHQILKHHQATKTNLTEPANYQSLTNSQWLHFSCHGYFNLISPLKSGLQLADAKIMNADEENTAANYLRINEEEAIDLAKCLTLEDIFQLNLSNCRLVCLSACETGLIDFTNTSDEYIGLPSGFIKAGAVNIVSSLWSVSDFHTALLMIKFYENLANHPDDVPLALNSAQKWMKEANTTQILNWISQILDEINISEKQRIINRLSRYYKPEEKPFDSPEYWAAFCAISPVYL
ncbi:MAG TPA: CHAT domain-containing protein [Nostocaceae cyanobacterium]|nr:CHAT domain-containing protein [Nostocaceae cyanobacterium]